MSQLTQREEHILAVCRNLSGRGQTRISVYDISKLVKLSVDRTGRYLRSLVKKGKLDRFSDRELIVGIPPEVRKLCWRASVLQKIRRAKRLDEELKSLIEEIEREVER